MNRILKYGGWLVGIALLFMLIFPQYFIHTGVSFALLAIFTQVCAKNVSGASKIFVADKSVATVISVASHEISGITGTTPFMRVDTMQDSVEWKEEETRVGLNNAKIANTINFDVMPPSTATSVFLQALMDGSPCGYFAIIVDGNGKCWLVGHNETDIRERPLRLGKITHDTGKGLAVATGNVLTITLENECSGLALPFDTTTNAAILGGTATFCKWS
jgi:hypothetical protein